MFKLFSRKKKEKIISKNNNKKETILDGKKKLETQAKEDEEWIYDYIYQFLISPYWTTPIQSFIDQSCILVENEIDEELKNNFKEFVLLKNEIISSLLSELKINHEKFDNFVKKGLTVPLHYAAFNQIKLMEDFQIFKNILIKRNKELNEEVLKNMEKNGKEKNKDNEEYEIAIKESLELQRKTSLKEAQEQEELEQVLKLSKEEYEEYLKLIEKKNEKKIIYQEKHDDFQNKASIPKHKEKNLFKIKSKNLENSILKTDEKSKEHIILDTTEEFKDTEIHEKKGFNKKFKDILDLKQKTEYLEKQPIIQKDGKIAPLALNPFFEGKENLAKFIETGKKDIEGQNENKFVHKSNKKTEKFDEVEDIYARKKRLLQQRDLLLKKKNEERERNLKNYQKRDEEEDLKRNSDLFGYMNESLSISKSSYLNMSQDEINSMEKKKEFLKKLREENKINNN